MGTAFLKTDGFAGVDRGVDGVEVPSNTGVLSPVLFPSFCAVMSGLSVVRGSVSPGGSVVCGSCGISWTPFMNCTGVFDV